MKDRFGTLQQRVPDLEQQLRETKVKSGRRRSLIDDMQSLHQERLDGLMNLIETLQEDEKIC